MKKIFLAVLLGLFPLSAFAFSDMQNSEFREFVENMANEKLISGYSDGNFRPNNSVSFFEALKIANNTTNGKTEIPADQNEWDFFRNIYENKFSQNEKFFKNNDKISRDFAMYIILKNIGVNLENTKIENNFGDVSPNSLFANYINFAKNNGIISGYANGDFWPNNNVSRGEFAKMTWKTIRENRENILQNYQKILDENKNNSQTITAPAKPDVQSATTQNSPKNNNGSGYSDDVRDYLYEENIKSDISWLRKDWATDQQILNHVKKIYWESSKRYKTYLKLMQ